MDFIIEKFLKALQYLFVAWIVYYAWNTARENAKSCKLKIVLWKGFLWCAGIGLFASMLIGKPTCIESEQDLQGTTCNEYADDGFTPTTSERAAEFMYFMTLFYLPVIVGAHSGNKEIERNQI